MLRKLIGVFAAVCLLCAAPALADDYTGGIDAQTTVEFVLEETYVMTIPPTLPVALNQEKTDLAVTVSGLRLLAPKDGQERVLRVKAAASGALRNAGGGALPYTLTPDVLDFESSGVQNMCVSIPQEAWNKASGGTYTDTVTFSAECVYRAQ